MEIAKISVVIPVYNEVHTIGTVIDRVLNCGFDVEIIAVDDGSTDGSREFLQRFEHPRVRAYFHARNKGKGAALRLGFAAATHPYVFVQDADLEYDPRDYDKLLEPLVDGRADVVFGSRFLGGPQRVHYFWHYVANKLLTLLSDIFTNLKLTDMETCYKVFRREVLQGITLKSDRFGFEPEITAKVAKGNWRVYEVPISYAGRTYEEGKKITWKDGLQALWCIIRFRFTD